MDETAETEGVSIPIWILTLPVIILVFIVAGVYLRFFYEPALKNFEPSDSKYEPSIVWNESVPSPGASCQTYQFKSQVVSSTYQCGSQPYDNEVFQMRSPTLDASILEDTNQTEIVTTQNCSDIDQINAINVTTTCDKLLGTTDTDGLAWCIDDNGTYYEYGDKIFTYKECINNLTTGSITVGKGSYCPGTISGLTVGFQANSFNDLPCVKVTSGNISVNPTCDLSNPDYIFRITHGTSLTSNPKPSSKVGTGNDGPYISIVHRQSGKCLIPSKDYPTPGTSLTLGNVEDNNNGFVWYLVPPLNTYVVWDSSINDCSCSTKCDSEGGPIGCVDDGHKTSSVMQIVYIDKATDPDFKLNRKNSSEICDYLSDYKNNYTLSLAREGSSLVLKPWSPYSTVVDNKGGKCNECNGYNQNSNFVTYQLYNTMSSSCTTWLFGDDQYGSKCK